MRAFRLPRRAILRGLGGVGVGLPLLEIMEPRPLGGRGAHAAGAPVKRFVTAYAGMSANGYTYSATPDLLRVLTPDTVGPGYVVSEALKPIVTFGVKDQVLVVSDLKIPWGPDGSVPGPAGKVANFHFGISVVPQISGTKAFSARPQPSAPTADQLVAEQMGGGLPVLAYRVQVKSYELSDGGYEVGVGNEGRLSWRKDPASGKILAVDPVVSPRLAYQNLFQGFKIPNTTAAEARQAEFLLSQRKSVIDLVRDRYDRLLPRLGAQDRQRLGRHFAEIRNIEKNLETLSMLQAQAGCKIPPDPGQDPAIGAPANESTGFGSNLGHSFEDRRAELLMDMVYAAFACDRARVASVLFTNWKSYMNINQPGISSAPGTVHDTTHLSNVMGQHAAVLAWHIKHMARLASKMKATVESDGRTMLDHAALTLLFEGGHGYDPETGAKVNSHSTERMVVLVFGGAAGGLKTGQHLAVGPQYHPGQVVLSAMKAAGYRGGLGDFPETATIPELFG